MMSNLHRFTLFVYVIIIVISCIFFVIVDIVVKVLRCWQVDAPFESMANNHRHNPSIVVGRFVFAILCAFGRLWHFGDNAQHLR